MDVMRTNAARNLHRGTGRTWRALNEHISSLSQGQRALYVTPSQLVRKNVIREAIHIVLDSGSFDAWSAFEDTIRRTVEESIVTYAQLERLLPGAGIRRERILFDNSCWIGSLVNYSDAERGFRAFQRYAL